MSRKSYPVRIPRYAAGIRAQESRTGAGRSWWAKEWARRLEAMGLKGRLGRGKSYALSSFGIKTLGITNAEKNEHNAYHIDGDADDENTSSNTDKLMAAIIEDPDSVVQFFQQLSSEIYDELGKKMTSTSMRTYGTFYNDKEMAKEYSDYTTTIAKWEEKLTKIEDSYYKKFAAMESALATLQSQTSQLSGLLGS